MLIRCHKNVLLNYYQYSISVLFRAKMPAPYEEWIISTKSGNCKNANKVTGTEEPREIGTTIHANRWSSTMQKVAANATSMAAIEQKSVARPTTNLFGKDSTKSSSA